MLIRYVKRHCHCRRCQTVPRGRQEVAGWPPCTQEEGGWAPYLGASPDHAQDPAFGHFSCHFSWGKCPRFPESVKLAYMRKGFLRMSKPVMAGVRKGCQISTRKWISTMGDSEWGFLTFTFPILLGFSQKLYGVQDLTGREPLLRGFELLCNPVKVGKSG